MPRPQPQQPMHIPAGLPIDQATRPELLDVGRTNILNENVRQDERGALRKRLGFAGLTAARLDATTRTTGNSLFSHKDLICTIDGTYLDSYAAGPSVSVVASRVPEASVTSRPLAIVDAESVLDLAHCNGYLATAALVVDPTNSYVVVSVETTDGVVVRASETMLTDTGVLLASLASYGVYIILFTVVPGSANIAAYYLDTTSAATVTTGWVSIGNVATDKTTSGTPSNRHCSTQSLTNRVAFAYVNDSGGASQITVKTLTIAGVVEARTVNTSSVKPRVVCIEGSIADTLWVLWNETTSGKLIGLDADNLAATLATTATVITYSTQPSRVPLVISSSTAGAGRIIGVDGDGLKTHVQSFTTGGGAVTPGTANTVPYGYAYNRPFSVGGRYYITAYAGNVDNAQNLAIIVDWTDSLTQDWFRPVANPFPNLVTAVTTEGRGVVHPWAVSATEVAVVLTVQRSTAATTAYLVTLDFADPERWQRAEHNESMALSGGLTSYFDGRRVAEIGFVQSLRTTVTTSGTGITGTFSYVTTVEEVDNAGNWCLSGVSLPVSTGAITNKTVDVFSTPLAITARRTANASGVDPRLRVRFWRTTDGGEPPYYLAGTAPHLATGTVFADTVSDATLQSNALLYGTGNLPATNGSGQDHRAPPSSAAIASYNGMLVVASRSDLYWSGQTISGEGTWFSPAFYTTASGPGDITALAVQDGALYAFKSDCIFVVSGEPPSDNGAAGGLGTPRRLAVDVGCISANSIVVTSMGIFFRSSRGIELLDRGGNVTLIGEPIGETLDSFPIVSRSCLDDVSGLVRIGLAESESGGRVSGEGRTVVYDLTLRTWVSRDDQRGASAHQASQDADMVYLNGAWRYAWLGTNGVVYYERDEDDASACLDGSSFVVASYTMPPWKMGLAQEQRSYEFMLTVERHSAAGLTVEVARDFGAFAPAETKTWAEAATASQIRLPFRPKPLTSAIQFRVSDTAPAVLGTGRGFTFVGLSADIAPKQGTTRGTPRTAPSLRR